MAESSPKRSKTLGKEDIGRYKNSFSHRVSKTCTADT